MTAGDVYTVIERVLRVLSIGFGAGGVIFSASELQLVAIGLLLATGALRVELWTERFQRKHGRSAGRRQ